MKTLLQHNQTRSCNQGDSEWVSDSTHAQSSLNPSNVEWFPRTEPVSAMVTRLDPGLLARFSSRAPGLYQAGE
jgi:NADH pyrophosphatase NudC (nudix superfamily)